MSKLNQAEIFDYGLVAYLRQQGYDTSINEGKTSYSVSLSSGEFEKVVCRYKQEVKPLLDDIRRIKKEISTPKS